MKALTSFLGVEGLIKKGQLFEVRDNARADYLESVYFAGRETGGNLTYETQAIRPSSTQVVAPTHTSIEGPENMPAGQPEQLKAPAPIIEAQESEEQQQAAPVEKTYAELKQEAKALKIKGYSSMKKTELEKALEATKKEEEK